MSVGCAAHNFCAFCHMHAMLENNQQSANCNATLPCSKLCPDDLDMVDDVIDKLCNLYYGKETPAEKAYGAWKWGPAAVEKWRNTPESQQLINMEIVQRLIHAGCNPIIDRYQNFCIAGPTSKQVIAHNKKSCSTASRDWDHARTPCAR